METIVRVILDDKGDLRADPMIASIDRLNQKLRWMLDIKDATWDLEKGGIVCKTEDLPADVSPWPAAQPALDTNNNVYDGDAGHPIPDGEPKQRYLYDINIILFDGTPRSRLASRATQSMTASPNPQPVTEDPDIENDPKP